MLAKEILQTSHQNDDLEKLAFYDDITSYLGDKMFNQFSALKSSEDAEHYFATIDNRFTRKYDF